MGDVKKVRQLGIAMCEYAKAFLTYEKVIESLAKIEKIKKEYDETTSFFWSDKQSRIVCYIEKVIELEEEKEDAIFNLSYYSKERVEDVRKMTLAEVLSFSERLNKKLKNGRRQYHQREYLAVPKMN